MENVPMIERLLGDSRFSIEDLVQDGPILDVGAGDGDIAFFFEDIGYAVDAVDKPSTNYNKMAGITTLREALGSRIGIFEQDLDTQFSPPRQHYGLCFALGLLYHLKNPFFFLERIQASADYCFLSTRVARFFPGNNKPMDQSAAAYLLDQDECNQDDTNYWIFSESGLRRILKRTGWVVRSYVLSRSMEDSDPIRADRDQRAFCLLQSSRVRPWRGVELAAGWHEMEGGEFRWTEKAFALRVKHDGDLRMKVFLPEVLFQENSKISLGRKTPRGYLGEQTFVKPGSYEVVVPALSVGNIEFFLDSALPPDQTDRRERGIVVTSIDVW
jgi:hypothetical protein